MSFKIKLISSIVFLIASQNVLANKELIQSNETNDKFLITDTIKKINTEEDIYQYWTEMVVKKDMYRDGKLEIAKDTTAKFITELNCKKETYKIVKLIEYNKNGEVIRDSGRIAEAEILDIPPETSIKEIKQRICKGDNSKNIKPLKLFKNS